MLRRRVLLSDFGAALKRHGLSLRRRGGSILQLNLGKLCNQTCSHCHVGAGPGRREIMTAETARRVIDWIRRFRPPTVDLTGGAPELCPQFRPIAAAARASGARVLVRCNLTVIFEEGQRDLPAFYRDHRLELICSLPCYLEQNVDRQRGGGVFEKSIRALRKLNELGYGVDERYPLTLVYNPVGATLPPAQDELERAYRVELRRSHGIEFHRLYCLANLPITRFRAWLERNGELESYRRLLVDSFNPATVDALMCRDTISVGWEGEVYDCDFNQMTELPMGGRSRYLWEVDPGTLAGEQIATAPHCFGCTAGNGSGCGGSLA